MAYYNIQIGDKSFKLERSSINEISIDSRPHSVKITLGKKGCGTLKLNDRIFNYYFKEISETEIEVWIKHYVLNVKIEDERSRLLSKFQKKSGCSDQKLVVKAPMPGLLKKIDVKSGDFIEIGSGLFILEAMKMENEIRSPISGIIEDLLVNEHSSVEKGQTILVIHQKDKNQ